MTPAWQPIAARIVQLLAAAIVGAVAVFWLAPKPASIAPLTRTDIGFAQDMSAHHQQAITMSDMVATDAAPEVRALADQIRLTQLREIGQMTGWLQLAGAPVVSPLPMAWMMADAGHHTGGGGIKMAGLASPTDLTRLQRTTGRDNEILFLQLMTRHHQGGIEMAAYAVQHSSTGVVHQTAVAMIDEQSPEMIFMAFLLKQRGRAPIAYP